MQYGQRYKHWSGAEGVFVENLGWGWKIITDNGMPIKDFSFTFTPIKKKRWWQT